MSKILSAAEWQEKKNGAQSRKVTALRDRLVKAINGSDRLPITVQAEAGDRDAFGTMFVEMKELGWKLRFVDDQRDGDYIEIEAGR